MDRHTALRTVFAWEGLDRPLQIVLRRLDVPIAFEDWRQYAPAEQARRRALYLADDVQAGFTLSRGPLQRLSLMQIGPDRHLFVWTHHHILLDGWSLSLLLREVIALYHDLRHGQTPSLRPSRPYGDFIAWLQAQDTEAAVRFWRSRLDDVASVTPIAAERPHREQASAQPVSSVRCPSR